MDHLEARQPGYPTIEIRVGGSAHYYLLAFSSLPFPPPVIWNRVAPWQQTIIQDLHLLEICGWLLRQPVFWMVLPEEAINAATLNGLCDGSGNSWVH
jgi:hypothetical protein